MRRPLAALPAAALAMTVLLAGCSQPAAAPEPTGGPSALPVTRDDQSVLMAHVGDQYVPVPEAWTSLKVRLADTGGNGAEPTLGVDDAGVIFVAAGAGTGSDNRLSRSTDHGKTWQLVGDQATDGKVNFDPWMWRDTATGRVFNAPLYIACTWASYTDDGGATWLALPHVGCGLPAHDHQKLTTGPFPPGVTPLNPLFPRAMYYAYNPFALSGHQVSVSHDGGLSWSPSQAVHPSDNCVVGAAGGVHVTPKGTAISAKPNCEGVAIAVSKDAGKTWKKTADVNDFGHQGGDASAPRIANPDLAGDASGNTFLTYVGVDGLTYVAWSGDEGTTWSTPSRVTPPGIQGTVFPFLAADGKGGVGVGYLATWDDSSEWKTKDAHDAADQTRWHLFFTFSEDATAGDPTWVSLQATPEGDPVQVGQIWLQGGGVPSRNLLDFNDAVQSKGRLYYSYTDGCPQCDTDDESHNRRVFVAYVEQGPSLAGGMLPALGSPSAT